MRAVILVAAILLSSCAASPAGPAALPLSAGYYVYDPYQSNRCGDYQSPVTLTRDVALHTSSRDPAAPPLATARSGEAVEILDCRVHFRPRRGEVLRDASGFEVGQPVYFLYANENEWGEEYFEHSDVFQHVWYRGGIVDVDYITQEDLFNWEPLGPGMAGQLQDGAGAGCWYLLDASGVRGWAQSADIDCYWTRNWFPEE